MKMMKRLQERDHNLSDLPFDKLRLQRIRRQDLEEIVTVTALQTLEERVEILLVFIAGEDLDHVGRIRKIHHPLSHTAKESFISSTDLRLQLYLHDVDLPGCRTSYSLDAALLPAVMNHLLWDVELPERFRNPRDPLLNRDRYLCCDEFCSSPDELSTVRSRLYRRLR